MSETIKDSDLIDSFIWQPRGKLFCCRTKFESGLVSGPSPAIDPRSIATKKRSPYGCGLYMAPGFSTSGILVDVPGGEVVSRFLAITGATGRFLMPAIIKVTIREPAGRTITGVELETKANGVVHLVKLIMPTLVPEGWNEISLPR